MAGWVELLLDQGTDFNASIVLTDDATGNPMNLVGYTANSAAKASIAQANASFYFQCSFSDAPNGNLQMALTSANSANIKPGRYYFDVKLNSPANIKTRVIEGIITNDGQVTV